MTNLVYFDHCCLQRPFDDRTQQRVANEAAAVEAVLASVADGDTRLVSSSMLEEESGQNPNIFKRAFVDLALAKADVTVHGTATGPLVSALEAAGVRPGDAAHVAFAVESRADYFCTCDDRLLKHAKATVTPPPKVVSPLELLKELGL